LCRDDASNIQKLDNYVQEIAILNREYGDTNDWHFQEAKGTVMVFRLGNSSKK
jgi:hypothetical protein